MTTVVQVEIPDGAWRKPRKALTGGRDRVARRPAGCGDESDDEEMMEEREVVQEEEEEESWLDCRPAADGPDVESDETESGDDASEIPDDSQYPDEDGDSEALSPDPMHAAKRCSGGSGTDS